MNWVTVVGYAAAFCSTVSFLPQAWRIIKTRDTSSISTPTYALTCVGFALWLTYGIARSEWPLVLTNGICLVLSLFILMMTVLPREAKERVADTLDPESG
jgi:MtN3 and saliva related transmembrane protein